MVNVNFGLIVILLVYTNMYLISFIKSGGGGNNDFLRPEFFFSCSQFGTQHVLLLYCYYFNYCSMHTQYFSTTNMYIELFQL